MMAGYRPIRTLELHYQKIQFLIKKDILRSSNSKIEKDLDTMKPRYNEHAFVLSLGPLLYRGTTVLYCMRNCG